MYLGMLLGVSGSFTAFIFRNQGGAWVALASAPIATGTGTLRFDVVGSSLKLFLNNSLIVYAYDSVFTAPGLAGIRGGPGVPFDNFAVSLAERSSTVLPFSDAFTQDDGAQLSPLWTEQAGNFNVQGGRLRGNDSFVSVATVNGILASDVRVESQVALPATGVQYAGLAARYSGPGDSNMYLAMLLGIDGSCTAFIFRNLNGAWTPLVSAPIATGTGALRFDVQGNFLRLSFNGTLVVSALDSTLTGPGSVGVRGGQGVTFDNFTATALAPAVPFMDDFNRASSTDLGSNWLEAAGNLEIQGNRLIPTTALDVALYTGASLADVAVAANVVVSASGVQYAGLAARYSGPGDSNMYLGMILGINGNFQAQIYRNVGGAWTLLASAAVATGTGLMRFEVQGSSLRLFFNSVLVTSATDATIVGPGLTGVRGGNGNPFDDFLVTAL
jgi:hypothetical protein